MYDGRTLVFGHRGARASAPMNTLAAFTLAAEQGAHGLELDVHRSKDGHPVLLHDFTVDSTTDGSGRVTDMTLAQLKELDAGSWFDPSFRGERIPTLDEVFEALGRRLYINVEIKAELPDPGSDGVEQVVADCIARHSMQSRVIVSSFNPLTLHRFRRIMPDVPIGFLYIPGLPVDTSALMQDLPHEALHPWHELIDADYMAQAHQQGRFVNTWTVNDPDRARELRDLGVGCIITDTPDVILQALQV